MNVPLLNNSVYYLPNVCEPQSKIKCNAIKKTNELLTVSTFPAIPSHSILSILFCYVLYPKKLKLLMQSFVAKILLYT